MTILVHIASRWDCQTFALLEFAMILFVIRSKCHIVTNVELSLQ